MLSKKALFDMDTGITADLTWTEEGTEPRYRFHGLSPGTTYFYKARARSLFHVEGGLGVGTVWCCSGFYLSLLQLVLCLVLLQDTLVRGLIKSTLLFSRQSHFAPGKPNSSWSNPRLIPFGQD